MAMLERDGQAQPEAARQGDERPAPKRAADAKAQDAAAQEGREHPPVRFFDWASI